MFKARKIPLKAPIKTSTIMADSIVLVFAKIDNAIPQTKHIINIAHLPQSNSCVVQVAMKIKINITQTIVYTFKQLDLELGIIHIIA